jgi:hypothetical protein
MSLQLHRVETNDCGIQNNLSSKEEAPITSFILNVNKIIVKKINYWENDLSIPITDGVSIVCRFFQALPVS